MLYEVLKTAKMGAGKAPDLYTAIMAQKMPFAKGSGVEHEYTGAVPATFTANGQPLLDYLISGNTVQSGTPTPDNPVMPEGTGERTGNLWNAEGFSTRAITSTHEHTNTNSYGTTISSTIGKEVSVTQADYPTGNVGYQNGFFFLGVDFSKYSIGDVITLSFDYIVDDVHALSTQTSTTLYAGKNNNAITPILSSGDWKISGRLIAVITIIADMSPYVEVRLCGNSITVKNIMLNSGSTALPYEPFGVKIPISSANTTTPVYLGEVQTTRKVKKLVLTGSETWYAYSAGNVHQFYTQNMVIGGVASSSAYSTIAPYGMTVDSRIGDYGCYLISSGNEIAFQMYGSKADFPTQTEWKAYLAQQYANGTPVTVWYVLATPETAVVNEPLMRIGDYTDTLSMEQANVEIPTARGTNTLDVLTDVKPSEVYIKYKS